MTREEYLKIVNEKGYVDGSGDAASFMDLAAYEAQIVLMDINNKFHTQSELQDLLSKLTKEEIDKGVKLFPPVYVDFKNWHETTQFDENKTLEKVINKAIQCQAKCVIVANIISKIKHSVIITHHNNITIIRCQSLMIDNVTSVDVNKEAASKIRRCINEISN